MQAINGFSSSCFLPLVKGERPEGQRGLDDARFLQSIIEVATGLRSAGQGGLSSVASAKEDSQPDFFANPEKAIGLNGQKNEKSIDDILAEIEKLLSQLKEENK